MTEATVALAAGCVLQIAEATFDVRGATLVEALHLEVAADPSCAWVELSLPRGSVLGEVVVQQKLGDGTGKRVGDERWEALPRAIDGSGATRLHLPELVSGDRTFVDVERIHGGPVTWRPGPARFVAAEARAGAALPEGPRVWRRDNDAAWSVAVTGVPPLPPLPPRVAPGVVRVEESLVLEVPPGDPQVALFPGGGSRVRVQRVLRFGASEDERAWPLDAPAGAEIALTSRPEGTASLERDPGAVRVVVPPGEGTAVTVQWTAEDAPTFGERGPELADLDVAAPRGRVAWEGDGWWLLGVNDRLVLPNRDVLIRALERRFRQAAIPEPGAPVTLRGRTADLALAADLRPALAERAVVGTWPADPLWPRKLVRARKQGALTPTEAAITLWLYAEQLGLDATWALVRPAPAGPGSPTVPAGIGAALVRVTVDGQSKWIDPSCGVCAPFELPPELEGATAWGPGITRTPAPTPGRHEVVVAGDAVTWSLQGPPALLLRRWLAEAPADGRTERLAERVGGPGARLLEVQGLDEAGAPIRVRATRAADLLETPLSTPPPRDGTVWCDWVGERVVVWPDHEVPDAEVVGEALQYRRTRTEAGLVESLTVTRREIPAAEAARVDAARRGE